MSSSPLKVIGVGSGKIGAALLQGLAANKAFDVSLLVRESSLNDAANAEKFDKLRAAGVKFVLGDASEPTESLAKKLAPFHTVISTVSPIAPTDLQLIEAIKAAGVKRFVPSSFGIDLSRVGRGSAVSLIDDKLDVEEALRKTDLDYLIFYTGPFTEFLISPFFGVDLEKGVVTAQVSFETNRAPHVSLQDIGKLVGAALLDSSLSRQIVRVASETVSYEQIVQLLEKHGKKVERKIVPAGGNRAHFDDPGFGGFVARFHDVLSTNHSFEADEAWNKRALPNLHTVTLEEYIQKL